ncbi:MAG: hypothetical protein IJY15_06430 [Thermoguttaceae bacterium]|nr:hypothetical protein [Thermoguttaceae bacterium]
MSKHVSDQRERRKRVRAVARARSARRRRAEPIAILYEQGRGRHVGTFETLEEQMLSFVGDTSEGSPDRLDALVWALTELSTGGGEIGGGTLE